MKLAIVGLGRMGSFLAEHFAAEKHELLLFDRNDLRKKEAAARLNAAAAENLEEVGSAPLIIMALPSEALPRAAAQLNDFLTGDKILINIATSLPRAEVVKVVAPEVRVVSVKMVGHALEMRNGDRPVVVVDGADRQAVKTAAGLFQSLGKVNFAKEEDVARLNTLAAAEGVRAAIRVKEQMEKEGLPIAWWETAVRLVAAGTMKAFASGDAGPFVQKIIADLERE